MKTMSTSVFLESSFEQAAQGADHPLQLFV
jgi:hypothetical protein